MIHDRDVRTYDLLRLETRGCPRLLVLLVLPEDEAQWLGQTVEELTLRRCAYWVSLRGAEPTANQATVRIPIPAGNVFSVQAIQTLLKALSEGIKP